MLVTATEIKCDVIQQSDHMERHLHSNCSKSLLDEETKDGISEALVTGDQVADAKFVDPVLSTKQHQQSANCVTVLRYILLIKYILTAFTFNLILDVFEAGALMLTLSVCIGSVFDRYMIEF